MIGKSSTLFVCQIENKQVSYGAIVEKNSAMTQLKLWILASLLPGLFASSAAFAQSSPLWPATDVIESRDCILQLLATKLNVTLKPELAKPALYPEGAVDLKFYQDSVEGVWGFRPDVVTNLFNSQRNEIFLTAQVKYYLPNDKSIFDSVAHELTHYIQVRYWNMDPDDTAESQAVEVQTWFRETYKNQVQGMKFVCPLNMTSVQK